MPTQILLDKINAKRLMYSKRAIIVILLNQSVAHIGLSKITAEPFYIALSYRLGTANT